MKRGVITHADKGAVAGIVAIRYDEVGRAGALNKLVEEMRLVERMAEPEMAAVSLDEELNEGIFQVAILVIIPARLFGRAGIMDVTDDGDLESAGHAASSRKSVDEQIFSRADFCGGATTPPSACA